jgi:predicted Rossmann fold flavoprotein
MSADYDIAVIGAGAAGLMAAIAAAECGRRVVLLEKNRRPGVKILMSGGTRCNITHDTDNRGIVAEYGSNGKFLHSALAAFSVQDTLDFFHAEGVPTKVEEPGKVFPVSNRAIDVLDALLRRLKRSGAELALSEPLVNLQFTTDRFALTTPLRTLCAAKVIITTGGKSYPGSGTTGDGYRIAAKFGHTIVPPRPALAPITTREPWIAGLRGVTLPAVQLRIIDGDQSLGIRRGSLLFAHFGLTGPVALDLSRVVSGHPHPNTLALEFDFLPAAPEADVEQWLQSESLAAGKKQLATVLAERLPHRLAETVLALTQQPIDRKAAGLNRGDRQSLVAAIKRLRVPITGTLGFEKAEVTAGGVALNEVDSRNMQSKKQDGLYIAGELLDLDGPIGGYNFQAAWSTGWLAGMNAASEVFVLAVAPRPR